MTFSNGACDMRTDLQRQLDTWVLPPDTHLQRMQYSDRAAKIFLELMHQYQDLLDDYAARDPEVDNVPPPYDATIHETLYTIQLITMALQNNHYRPAALALELTQNCTTLDDVPLLLEAIEQLRDFYHHVEKQSMYETAKWLFRQHGFHLWIHDHEVAFISLYLQEPVPGGVGMPPFDWRPLRGVCVCVCVNS